MSEEYESVNTISPEETPEESAEFASPGNIRDLKSGDLFEFSLINSETGGKRAIRCIFKEIFKDMASGDKIRLRIIDCDKTDDLILPLKDFESGYSPKIIYRQVSHKNLVEGEKYFFDYIDEQGNPRVFSGFFAGKSYFEKEGKDYFCFRVGSDTFYCSSEEFGEFKFRSIVSTEEEQETTDLLTPPSSELKGFIAEGSEEKAEAEDLEIRNETAIEVERETEPPLDESSDEDTDETHEAPIDEDESVEEEEEVLEAITQETPEESADKVEDKPEEETSDEHVEGPGEVEAPEGEVEGETDETPEESVEDGEDKPEEEQKEESVEDGEDKPAEEQKDESPEESEEDADESKENPEEIVELEEVKEDEKAHEEEFSNLDFLESPEYTRDFFGVASWIEDRFRKNILQNGLVYKENDVITVEELNHYQIGLLLTSLFKQFPDIRDQNLKFSYDRKNLVLRIWGGDRNSEDLIEDDHVKAYALAVENKDRIEADWRKEIVLQDMKIKSRKSAESVDFSNEEARNKFLGDSITDFLDINSEVVETRIASKKEKSEKEGSGFGKLFGKMKKFVSGVADKWRKAKWPVKLGFLGAAAVGGAFIPVAAPWLGLGVMGLGAAALQPTFRDIGYKGFKRGGRFGFQLGDHSIETASAYSTRMRDVQQNFEGEKMESYRDAIEKRIAKRFGNKNSEGDFENPSEDITSIMTEEYNKVLQKIENMHYRLAYRRLTEFGAAFGTIAAFGYGVKAAVGGVLGALGSTATEAVSPPVDATPAPIEPAPAAPVEPTPDPSPVEPAPVPTDPDAASVAPVETDAGAEIASIVPDGEFVGNFHSVGHPDVYDPSKTLIQYDASDLSQVNSAVNPVAGTEVEISTRSGNLNYRTGAGEILNSLPRGTDLTLTGETKVFEVTSKFNPDHKVLATFFEAVDANGNRGYFAGSYLQVK